MLYAVHGVKEGFNTTPRPSVETLLKMRFGTYMSAWKHLAAFKQLSLIDKACGAYVLACANVPHDFELPGWRKPPEHATTKKGKRNG